MLNTGASQDPGKRAQTNLAPNINNQKNANQNFSGGMDPFGKVNRKARKLIENVE